VLRPDRKLAYDGGIDKGYHDFAKAEKCYLRGAAEAVLTGGKVAEPVTVAMGRSIKSFSQPAGLHRVR